MPSLSLGLNLAGLGGSSGAIFGASPYVVNFTLPNSSASPNFSFDSIPNYTNYIDPNIAYSLPLSPLARGRLHTIYPSAYNAIYLRNTTGTRNFYIANSYGGYDLTNGEFYFILIRNGSTYTTAYYKQVLDYTDSKGNNYYTYVLETTWTFSWNGTAWQLFGKASVGATAGVIKTYIGGSASVLPPQIAQANSLDLEVTYPSIATSTLSDTNMNGTSNQIFLFSQAANSIYKTKTSSATLTQAGKLGLIFNFTLPSVYTTGSPSVSALFSNSYTALFSPLFTILSAPLGSVPSPVPSDVYLPKDAVESTPISLTTNGDLTNLTSSSLSLSQTSVTIPTNVFSALTSVISASLLENTTSSNRALSISGTKTYDNTSFTANSNVYQIGTTAPNPIISISSNNTTPRDFFLTHTGNTLSTRTLGEPEGLALWDSVRKLWAIPKMGRYIRYFGGKYQFIEISGSSIVTPVANDSLSETNACSPSVMPWNATWIRNIDVSKNYFDAMQKPTTLQINGTIYFPYSNNQQTDYQIKSSQQQIGLNGVNDVTFKCGQYRKLVFKGIDGGYNYSSSGVNMVYSYAENKWFLTIYEYYSYKGSNYGNVYTYSAPYSTSFPITFTYVSRANTSSSTNITSLVVSKVTASAFDANYTLADATYPITIPVDTAFSSIW